jgi:hypothetical protein
VVRPAGIVLDKLADPAAVIADDSVLWEVYRQFRGMGLHKAAIPKTSGGMLSDTFH